MRRIFIAAVLAVLVVAMPSAAWAAPTTQVIQGSVLRLVSVADWAAAGSLLPGQPVRWDVAVSAHAPDPGVVRIGISATGEARLLLDVSTCPQAWTDTECPGGATELRTGWSIPRDGVEVPLTEIADTETAYLRLAIFLDPSGGSGAGSTDVRVLAQGAGETVTVGSDGGLATTGLPPGTPWAVGVGAILVAWGAALVHSRRRLSVAEAGSAR
ncbi:MULTISPECIES: hypothetical protein [unclassified Microbacterium]|uniref:hypothetical protein n=1 Tax=unclassified Microbacterium TaxID=2609290 RepID=UPI000CFC4C16|nr:MULTISPECIES: hypothetical protein [unclassified Microbacterium]PQZ52448.1 hypothetical protein CQ032_17205 [Microbacterium sp. MYb43]PQZ73048.1 hypothetical protein CQ031_18005 [Microbacterium sp. MYb40]PRB21895.1 hypothetical protein CQ040_08220 [Microbacterium sp. MYb54]PRB31655.1 hypothetical protein CQ037_03040 [Microbacterium sp. MYb50]PRB61776.1 hypothetical protein CQ021_17675 [Microbacterium sp. MYb24]